jgi:hypothetical protein
MKVSKEECKEKNSNILCSVCQKYINTETEKYVTLSTFNIPHENKKALTNKHVHYHWACFMKQYNEAINMRIKERLADGMAQVKTMLNNPLLQDLN